jgi:butyryl-CoA dehydrogenase
MILDFSPDQLAYRDRVRAFAQAEIAPAAASIDQADRFPRDIVRRAAAEGLLGITLAPEWGGRGRDDVSYALAIEAVAYASVTAAVILVVQNSLVVEPLARFGTTAQQERWLGRLARGEAIGSFAQAEPEVGTDVGHVQTTALLEQGGQAWRMNGRKVWVANGEVADLAIVFAIAEARTGGGVTAFLVPLDSSGVTRVERNESLGVRGLGCFTLDLREVRVDAEQVLGRVGEGFAVARWALAGGRVAIAAQALGLGEAAVDLAIAYAKVRKSFGQPIASYEAIQWMLADSATEMEAARMLTLKAASVRRVEHEAPQAAAMAKLYASEAACRATDHAMQILASEGYRRGSTVERLFRDARASEIYQGTSEVQRMIISAHVLHGTR